MNMPTGGFIDFLKRRRAREGTQTGRVLKPSPQTPTRLTPPVPPIAPKPEVLPEFKLTGEAVVPTKETASIWDTFRVFGEGLTKLPKQLGASILQATQGQGGASVVNKDWADRFIQDANIDIEQFTKEVSEKYEETKFPIKLTDLAQLPRNIAYSLTSMGAGLGVGVPIALIPLPGARVVAWGAGSAASGAVAYGMTTYQIMQQYLELMDESKKIERGKGLTLTEETKLKKDFERKATEYGLWEAVPEAISNLAFAKILTTPLINIIGKPLAVKLISKISALYGEELLTETITQKGQAEIEAEVGLGGKLTWLESFKAIAPQTFLLTTILGGVGQTGISAVNRIKASLKTEIGESHPSFETINNGITEATIQEVVVKPTPVTPEVTKTYYHGARTSYTGKPRGDIAYVSESKYTAEMYGTNIREFSISPEARILKYDDLPRDIKHTVVSKEKKSIEYAKQKGYDGVEVLQNNKTNVAIWNKDILQPAIPKPVTPEVTGVKAVTEAAKAGEITKAEFISRMLDENAFVKRGDKWFKPDASGKLQEATSYAERMKDEFANSYDRIIAPKFAPRPLGEEGITMVGKGKEVMPTKAIPKAEVTPVTPEVTKEIEDILAVAKARREASDPAIRALKPTDVEWLTKEELVRLDELTKQLPRGISQAEAKARVEAKRLARLEARLPRVERELKPSEKAAFEITKREVKPAIPKAEPGMPEAGIQETMLPGEVAFPPSNPPSGRPRTLSDLNREAKGMRAMTPEQRAEAADVARPIPEEELLYKVKPFEEHGKNLLMPDSPIMARLRSLPGIKQTVGAWNPAQMARDNPVHMIGITKAIFEEIETGRARTAALAWFNDAENILGFKESRSGVWKAYAIQPTAKADTKKANYRTVDDILENPSHYTLTSEQKKVLSIGQNMQRQLLRDAQRAGVNVVELGESYWHRIVLKGPKDKMQGHWIRGRISGRKGYTHQRAFEKIDQGTELGFVYETHPLTRLQARLEAGIRTISDQEARKAISRLPGVEKPLERMESRYPQTLEGQKTAKEARNAAKQVYLKDKTVENYTELRQAEADYITAMREVFKRKIEVGTPGYYELRLPNGKIAPGELVEEVKKYIELPEVGGTETARTVVEMTRLVRTTLTNVDLAAGFIQGQILFYRHNVSWWKAHAHAIVSLIDDPYAYVAKNQELMDEGMRVGAISIPTEFMFSKRGIASIPTRIPGIGPVMRACNRAFEWFIVVGQTELYRTTRTGVLKGVAKKEARVARKEIGVKVKPEPIAEVGAQIDQEGVDALVSLGSAIRKELGTDSYAILGVGPRQRTVEQLTAFAARFFRANVGIIGQSFTKGEGGTEARKGLGSLIVGGTLLLIGVSSLMYGKLPNLDDPFAPDWMMVRIGKTYFSPFGPFYPYFRAIARAGVRTAEGKPLEAANEIKRFLQGRAGIPYRALDITGQLLWANEATTFEGEVIERTPLGIVGGVLGELAVPISIQEAMQAIPQGRPEAAVAEIFGLVGRGSPYAQMDMMFQGETDINPEGKSFRYAERWQEKEMAKRFPDIAEMMAGRGHGKYGHAVRQWNDIDKEYYAQEEALAKEFEDAEASGFEEGITHSEFGDRYQEIQKARINKKAGVNQTLKLFQDERELPDDPNDRALAEYFQVFDKARTASGRINWDESDELMVQLEATWTPEQQRFVEDNTGLTDHPPLIEEYRKARKTVQESGYWDLEEPNQYEKRQSLRLANPEIDAILVRWYGYKPRVSTRTSTRTPTTTPQRPTSPASTEGFIDFLKRRQQR